MTGRRSLRLFFLAGCLTAAPTPLTKGRVVDAVSLRGIPGVTVTPLGHPEERTLTDASGNFAIAEWRVSFSWEKPGYEDLKPSDLDGLNDGHPEMFDVNGVREWTPWLHQMMPQSVLSGVVVEEGGKALAGARVTLNAEADLSGFRGLRRPPAVLTDAAGHFRMTVNSLPTVYAVTAGPRCISGVLQLEPTSAREVRWVLPRAAVGYTVSGTVTNEVARFPRGEISVELAPAVPTVPACFSRFRTASALDQSGGRFSIPGVPSGSYQLTVRLHPNSSGCDTCVDSPAWTFSQNVTVTDADVSGVAVTIVPGVELSVVLHREAQPPQAGADLATFERIRGGTVFVERPPNSGLALSPGTYRVGIRQRDFYVREVRMNGTVLPGNLLTVTKGMPAATLDLFPAPLVQVGKVVVKDPAGRPISSYSARLLQQREGRWTAVALVNNTPGEYRLIAITPALPRVMYRAEILESYAELGKPVTLRAGESAEIQVVAIERPAR